MRIDRVGPRPVRLPAVPGVGRVVRRDAQDGRRGDGDEDGASPRDGRAAAHEPEADAPPARPRLDLRA